MPQLSLENLWESPVEATASSLVTKSKFQPRDYQLAGIKKTIELFDQGSEGVMFRQATGTGKTVTGCFLIDQWLNRGPNYKAMVIAHERQLIWQFADEIEDVLSIQPGIEMGDRHVHPKQMPDIIVACRASLAKRVRKNEDGEAEEVSRLYKFNNKKYNWLVLWDEAHRTKRSLVTVGHIIEWFEQNPESRRIGLTATPERSDKISLRGLFPDIGADYPLYDINGGPSAVRDGWAVPYDQRFVIVEGLDFTNLNEVAGDYTDQQLEEILAERDELGRIIDPTIEIVEDRQTLIFNPGVKMSRKVAGYLNAEWKKNHGRDEPIAYHIDGSTPEDVRKEVYRDFEDKKFQFLSVCSLCREGYNNCLDDETEILLVGGWRKWNEIKVGDSMYSLNLYSNMIERVDIQDYTRRLVHSNERMVTFKSQHMNIRVTEGHDLHIRKYDCRKTPKISREFTAIKARDAINIKGELVFPLSANLSGFMGVDLTDDELKFIAWFMTNGGFSKRDVAISQSTVNQEKADRIERIIQSCGFDYRRRVRPPSSAGFPTNNSIIEFSIPKGTGSGSKKRNGWYRLKDYLTKDVSPLLHDMTREQFEMFWLELLLGDGSVMPGKSGWLLCDRKTQVDAYMKMAVIRGFATSYADVITDYGTLVWRVTVRDKETLTTRPTDKRAVKILFDEPESGEHVWCVTNKNGTLISRRGGKVIIIGNCSLQAVAVFRPTKSRPLAEQMRGRSCRPLRGLVDGDYTAEQRKDLIANSEKPNAIIVDLVGISGIADCASTAHLLAQGEDDEVIERANEMAIANDGPNDMGELVKKARDDIENEREVARERYRQQEEAARKRAEDHARFGVSVRYSQIQVQQGEGTRRPVNGKQSNLATPKQIGYLFYHKIPFVEGSLTKSQAGRVIGQHKGGMSVDAIKKCNKLQPKQSNVKPYGSDIPGNATESQVRALGKLGVSFEGALTVQAAGEMIMKAQENA